MTPRQRWHAVLSRQKPDRVPTDYWATSEVTDRLKRELHCADEWTLWDKLQIDRLVVVAPRYVGPDLGGDDIWGVPHRTIVYADGAGRYSEVADNPMARITTVEQVHAYPWPRIEWYDFADLSTQADQVLKRGYPVYAGHYEPFLTYCQLRSLEQAFMDLAAAPEIVDAILDHLFDFHYQLNSRMFETIGPGRIDITYVAEDLGTQESLLMSEAMVDRFLKPKMKKMIDLAHQFGITVFYHSDGAVLPLIEGLIAIGIELLNPIQWRCKGMDREGLKRDFGDRLILHGGVDNQKTLPFGTSDDVRQEVIDNLRILGAGGGYILAPCHNIQPITPTENILALYETVAREGRL